MIKHIEILLGRHDYVIIPNFGGFILQRESAVISNNEISPPLSNVSFNPLMNISDGLLAIEISRNENISFREAMKTIEREVEEINQKMQKQQTINCGRLGKLSLNEAGKVTFSPAEKLEFLPANYGLKSIHISTITEQQHKTADSRKTITITLPRLGTVARYAAGIAIMFGVALTIPKSNQSGKNLSGFNLLNSEIFVTNNTNEKQKNSKNTVAKVNTYTPIDIYEPELNIKRTEVAKINNNSGRFYIIVASLAKKSDAKKFNQELKDIYGFENSKIISSRYLHKVAITSFHTNKEAYQYMEEIKSTYPIFEDSWIFVAKK